MPITGGGGFTLDIKTGRTRRWYARSDGIKKWFDNDQPVEEADADAATAGLTGDQRSAIERYASKHGRYWKNHLGAMWMNGTDAQQADGALLRQIRNTLGPTWLAAFRL